MDTIIVGGGVGGLTLALAMHASGAPESGQGAARVAGYHVQQVGAQKSSIETVDRNRRLNLPSR